MKKIFARSFSILFAIVVLVVILGVTSQGYHSAKASTGVLTSTGLTGWAWSDNIGWISFDGPSYNVSEDSSGNLTGYAWSDNIGWIKFGGLSGWPTDGSGTSNENAIIDSSNELHGWARACSGTIKSGDSVTNPAQVGDCSSMTSRTDGWDGWISLDGTSYNVTFGSGTGQYGQSAYVWGSDVVGWVNFNPFGTTTSSCDSSIEVCNRGSSTLTPTVYLYLTSSSVAVGSSTTLSWNTSNITDCTESSSGANGLESDLNWLPSVAIATSSGSQSTSAFNATGTETYTLSCIDNSQTATPGSSTVAQATLSITAQNNNNNNNNNPTGSCTPIVNASLCSNSVQGSGPSALVSSASDCPTSGSPSYICIYACLPNTHMVGTSSAAHCVGNGTLQEQ